MDNFTFFSGISGGLKTAAGGTGCAMGAAQKGEKKEVRRREEKEMRG
jgi:hypothetical protein